MSTAAPPLPAWPVIAPRPMSSNTQPVPASTCTCTQTYALTVQQGATLSTKLTLTITDTSVQINPLTTPVDITGCEFQFTAKTDPSIPDNDPTTVMIDWTETSTPTQGITWLVIPAATTQNMLAVSYVMQIRMVSSGGVVTPLVGGSLTVTAPPASARFD
jgi:hypothetical protein